MGVGEPPGWSRRLGAPARRVRPPLAVVEIVPKRKVVPAGSSEEELQLDRRPVEEDGAGVVTTPQGGRQVEADLVDRLGHIAHPHPQVTGAHAEPLQQVDVEVTADLVYLRE